jgi:hypothetical protein
MEPSLTTLRPAEAAVRRPATSQFRCRFRPSGIMDVIGRRPSPWHGGHTLERWLRPDWEKGGRSCRLGAQRKHLRLPLYEVRRTEGLKAVPHTKNGFDVLAAVLAQLSAQPQDVHVQRACANLVAVAPHTQ